MRRRSALAHGSRARRWALAALLTCSSQAQAEQPEVAGWLEPEGLIVATAGLTELTGRFDSVPVYGCGGDEYHIGRKPEPFRKLDARRQTRGKARNKARCAEQVA